MTSPPLRVAFLWHMHQPYYRNPRTGVYALPWVRLHTVKDYHDMVVRLESFPAIRANFNLVPCLIEQILDYAEGGVKELHLEMSRKPAADLEEDEKVSVLRHFFLGNRRTMIEPYPRYRSLLEKCRHLDSEYKVEAAVRRFSRQDFLDLQVWSNLAWMGPIAGKDPVVAAMLEKGRQFSEAMKQDLLGKQMDIMACVLDRHKRLAENGQIEISTSPYFHPIIPLLCDSLTARKALPGVSLPASRISFPEDARDQILSGLRLHEKVFGKVPLGIWPPEAAVSDETAAVAAKCGMRWMATDESILAASVGVDLRGPDGIEVKRPDLLYRPHRVRGNGTDILVIFRDRVLSDLISFGYRDLGARDAVSDFMNRLHAIGQTLGQDRCESVVLVALDGENCWEFYDRGGDEFLTRLYKELSRDKEVETVLISEVLKSSQRTPDLKEIFPGSWIGHSLGTWIGRSEDNRAWQLLYDTRASLKEGEGRLSESQRAAAWRSIYAAEGSDWFWWYGGDRTSHEDTEFDALFRAHLRFVYETLGCHVPHDVLTPVMAKRRGVAISFEPAAVIKPVLDGRVTTFYEWKLAGLYESYRDSSRTIFGSHVLDAVYFGFDHENLYLRLDTSISPQAEEFSRVVFAIEFEDPAHNRITLRAPGPRTPEACALDVEPPEMAARVTARALEIVEMAVPFDAISAVPGGVVSFRVALLRDGKIVEHRPVHEMISLRIPAPDFEAEMWSTL